MGAADPYEPPCLPVMQWSVEHDPGVVLSGGPARIYDEDAADPDWEPKPVGFAPPE